MKNYISKLLALVALVGLTANAQTNTVATPALATTVESGKPVGGYEFTLGGGGTEINGESAVGLDFSLSTNPFESLPSIWVGIAQGLYWEPSFAGSTDLFVDFSHNVWNETVYLNVGWSGGLLYATKSGSDCVWRTGPELTVQYYTSGNAFLFAGVNYDVYSSDGEEGNWRYSFGIGIAF